MIVKCEKHGIEYENEKVIVAFGGREMRFSVQCPECNREFNEEQGRAEAAESEKRHIEHIRSQNIEPAYFSATLDNFQADSPELQHAALAVRKMIAHEIQQIVMTGKNGTGKTHLAVAAVKELDGKIFSMYEITTRIRASYTARAQESELDIVDELARLPMLAIDEIGRTKGSDAETNWLSYIIDKRHARSLPTIIISNKHVKKDCPQGGCENCLENYLSEDIMSRITENGILLRFMGEDWRKKKRVSKKQEAL